MRNRERERVWPKKEEKERQSVTHVTCSRDGPRVATRVVCSLTTASHQGTQEEGTNGGERQIYEADGMR